MEPTRVRKYPRIPVDLPVEYSSPEAAEHARGLILGGGGMYIGTSQTLTPGTPLTVRFRPAKHLPVVEARARVCYLVAGQGIGVEFLDISTEHRDSILRLIHHRMKERRRFPRAPLATQVQHAEGTFIGFSRDISTGGMFVETDRAIEPGTKMNLRFHLEPQEPIVKADAEVLYQVPKVGIGLQFTEVSPEDFERINVFVSRKDAAAVAGEQG
jgi:c-di-GMP-binding flagellar brake protein YcgR